MPCAISVSFDPGTATLELPFKDVLATPTARSAEALAGNDDPMRVVPEFPILALKFPEESGTDCCPLKLETTVVVGSIP
jgi:hypothetical protein